MLKSNCICRWAIETPVLLRLQQSITGTFHSTFTGYIHRLRGYHGLAESSYYHTTGFLMHMKMKESVGHGFSREWRAGWTDDAGGSI
jgi:hypothetical protein